MKTKRAFLSRQFASSVAVLAIGLAMQAFGQSDTLLSSTIVRLKGHARCSPDGGKTWKMVQVGDTLASGSIIQTAFKSDMDVVLGAQAETAAANFVSLAEDTLLRLDKIVRKQAPGSGESGEEISLDLRKGTVTGNVPKLTKASRYEIAFVNGVAGTREGIYTLRANGELKVLKGKAFIALADGRAATEVAVGQQFHPGAGTAAALPQGTHPISASQPPSVLLDEPGTNSIPKVRETDSPSRRTQPTNTGLRRVGP